MEKTKNKFYKILDNIAKKIASDISKNKKVTQKLLIAISDLYDSANSEKKFGDDFFRVAYHNPVTSEFEFLIARILYHYGKKFNWKIYLRNQSKGKDGKLHVPDIRIEKNGKNIAIIEIKVKAGWIQYFFSKERVKKDLKRYKEGSLTKHPKEMIKESRKQLKKYSKNFNVSYSKVFVLLPTLKLVHRKKSQRLLVDYKKDFSKHAKLPEENLIMLSENLNLDLEENNKTEEYKPTNEFEKFVRSLK